MSRSGVRFVSLAAIGGLAMLAMSAGHSPVSGLRLHAQEAAKPQGKLKDLLKERAAITKDASRLAKERFKAGSGTFEELLEPMRQELEAVLELCESAKERVDVLEKFLAIAKDTEQLAAQLAKAGQGKQGSALTARAERLRIEIALERANAKVPAKGAQELQDQADLAEKRAAIKRAAVKVVVAQKARVTANVAIVKAQLDGEKAEETHTEAQMKRIEALAKAKAVYASLCDEHRAKLDAARLRRAKAESAVTEAESLVAIEEARIVQAQLEVEEADLLLKQLKARLRALQPQ